MSSSIQFTQEEAQRVFAAFLPGFRADAQGPYRGPATYRGGDNKHALYIDAKQGSWSDGNQLKQKPLFGAGRGT
jgi:hypothetical protein